LDGAKDIDSQVPSNIKDLKDASSTNAPSTTSDAPSTTSDAPSTTSDAPLTTSADINTTNSSTHAPKTTKSADFSKTPDSEIVGYYSLSWNGGNIGPKNSNTSVFFNGWNSVKKGMDEYEPKDQPTLKGFKYFSFGGGDESSGYLNVAKLRKYIKDIPLISSKGFQGVMFDVEIVHDSADVMNPAFADAFAATKQAGLKVGITTSHSAPCKPKRKQDSVDFIKAWVKDTNVDVISPQLYENGNETSPQFEPTADCADLGCTYDVYKDMHAGMQFAPSITYAKQYSKVQKHFKENYNIDTAGYLVYYENDDELDESEGCNPMLWDCETKTVMI
jgi:hypothetical protein